MICSSLSIWTVTILPLSWPHRIFPSIKSRDEQKYGISNDICFRNSYVPLSHEWMQSLKSLPVEISHPWLQTTAVHSPAWALRTRPSSPLWSQQWTAPFAPPEYAIPSESNATQLNLVWVKFGPNAPFLNSFFEESAGCQNYRDLLVRAQNLKSLSFLDHLISVIASVPAET